MVLRVAWNPAETPRRLLAGTMARGCVADLKGTGRFGIAVVSPRLDEAGNSVRAQRAIEHVSNALGGNPYQARGPVRVTEGANQ